MISFFTLLLSKTYNHYVYELSQNFSYSYVIHDNLSKINDQYFCDNNYAGMTKITKKPSAWDKAFYFIDQNYTLLDEFDYFFFIEDDVFSRDTTKIYALCCELNQYNEDLITHSILNKNESTDWFWWKYCDDWKYFQNPYCSFNPFCRLSSKLVKKILEYRTSNGFIFNDIFFASLCKDNNMTFLDINNISQHKFFGKFQFRPYINKEQILDNLIYHPVKPEYIYSIKEQEKQTSPPMKNNNFPKDHPSMLNSLKFLKSALAFFR